MQVEQPKSLAGDRSRVTVTPLAPEAAAFVRQISKPKLKSFDLANVVAGGDGFSGQRGRGIKIPTECLPKPDQAWRIMGDYRYHRIMGMPFIDGVFIPDGSKGPVQVSSAGHTLDCLPRTANSTSGAIWSGRDDDRTNAIYTRLNGVDYASPGHGVLAVTSNKGITFDLQAIRKANPGWNLLRFRAITGSTKPMSEDAGPWVAEVWVLVDGQMRFRRRDIDQTNGAMPINIRIRGEDRFLTLMATDGGDDIFSDWIIFGDPRLELLESVDSAHDATRHREILSGGGAMH